MVDKPDTPIKRLCFISAPEREMLLHTFNASPTAAPALHNPAQTIHGMLEHWAAATPHATAAVFEACTRAQQLPLSRKYIEEALQSVRKLLSTCRVTL